MGLYEQNLSRFAVYHKVDPRMWFSYSWHKFGRDGKFHIVVPRLHSSIYDWGSHPDPYLAIEATCVPNQCTKIGPLSPCRKDSKLYKHDHVLGCGPYKIVKGTSRDVREYSRLWEWKGLRINAKENNERKIECKTDP